jgi:hypothetical protein
MPVSRSFRAALLVVILIGCVVSGILLLHNFLGFTVVRVFPARLL